VGTQGVGTLNLTNGGEARPNVSVVLSPTGAGTGTLNIGNGEGPGILDAAAVASVGVNATVNFNHTDADYYFTNDGTAGGSPVLIVNTVAVNHIGSGTTTLLGGNSYSGATTVDAGTLLVDGSVSVSTVTVNAGGTLGGSGSVAKVNVNGGTVAPGGSPGKLTIANNYSADANATLAIDIGGTTSGTQYDRLAVNHTATLGGTLDLSYVNDFTAAPGQSFVILTAGTLSGTFATVNFPDGQDWFIDYDTVNGKVTVSTCPDDDGDGVCNADDLCPNTIPGVPVDADGCPDPSIPADFDHDGDVDNSDFEALRPCLGAPEAALSTECEPADLDGDGDSDLADFVLFEVCFSGHDVPADPNCTN